MRAFTKIASALAASTCFATAVLGDLDPIVIKGSKFFYKTNGTEFFIKGIAYQQDFSTNATAGNPNATYVDPLADQASCARDIPYLVQLQTNTIRVYALDPTLDHSACMSMLTQAGIYVIADLSQPAQSIIRDAPVWDDDLYARYTAVIDDMAQYTNTIGFFAGNEVSNNNTNTGASAFVKAAVRDMKKYIVNKKYRPMGVGYATNDDASIRSDMEAYFNCGPAEESIDFWGYNIYSWCGDSSYTTSGYDQRTKEFSQYTVPVFFAEYGCNKVEPRLFSEVGALYGSDMTPVWSGGIVYMYFQETNDFGLVSVSGSNVSPLPDFTSLSSQLAKVTPTGVQMAQYSPTNTVPSSCPTIGSNWQAASALPPTPDSGLCQCMIKAVTCVPSNKVTDTNIGDLFGYLCGLPGNPCAGISTDPATGVYGAYSMCNPREKLAFALDTYDRAQKKAGNTNGCDFGGSATIQSAANPTGSCSSKISQAGDGTTPTASSGSGSSSTSHAGAIPGTPQASLNLGTLHIGIYLVFAVLSGAGMILL